MNASRAIMLLGVLGASSVAEAAEPVLVSPASREGEVEEAVSRRLEDRLLEALRKSELDPIALDAAAAAAADACTDDACRASVLAGKGGRFLVVPSLAIADQDYRLTLTLYGAGGQQLARVEETCGLCGLAEAEDLLADLGARIGRKVEVAARVSTLSVTSDPPGARIYLGDEWVGTTPFELPLELGAHPLRIELDGYIAQQRSIDAVAGEHLRLAFDLQPIAPEPRDAPDPRAKLLGGLGWTALGLGLGTAAAGSVLIGLDEQPITSDCSGTNVDAAGHCRWRHATLEPGIGLVVGGATLVGTAVALLLVARKRDTSSSSQARIHVQPSLGGLTLSF